MLEVKGAIYAFSKDAKPVATVKNNDVVKFVIHDCYEGQIKTEKDVAASVDWKHTNPAAGPVYIEGAEAGDALAVDILDISVADKGVVCSIPECGPFAAKSELRTHVMKIKDGKVYWDKHNMVWPAAPMVGVIGTAPDGEDIATGFVGNHGGNMDNPMIQKGVRMWFPVRVKGALLAMGDLHATMADGEVCGNGIEIAGEVIVRVSILKNFKLNWPILETKDAYYVNTRGATCDEAIHSGYVELHRLISNAYGLDYTDTSMYMSIQGLLSANQACLVAEAGGNSFRVGTPKVLNKKPLIG